MVNKILLLCAKNFSFSERLVLCIQHFILSMCGRTFPNSTSEYCFIFHRAAQKLNLSSKRRKAQPTILQAPEPSIYPTNFSSILQLFPPPVPPCLFRASSKAKENPGIGKVRKINTHRGPISLLTKAFLTVNKELCFGFILCRANTKLYILFSGW